MKFKKARKDPSIHPSIICHRLSYTQGRIQIDSPKQLRDDIWKKVKGTWNEKEISWAKQH